MADEAGYNPDVCGIEQERWKAHHLRLDGRTEEAIDALRALLERDLAADAEKDILVALVELHYYLKDREGADVYMRRARHRFPELTFDFGANYSSVLDGNSVMPEYVGNLPNFKVQGYARPTGIREFPKEVANLPQLEAAIEIALEDYRAEKLFDARSRLVTAGSCFASNLRSYLLKCGIENTEQCHVPDGLDSSFAIRSWVDFALMGATRDAQYWYAKTDSMIRLYASEQSAVRRLFDTSDGVILTLGLAQIWEDALTGGVFWRGVPRDIYDQGRHRARMSTVSENVANIRQIIESIREWRGDYPIIFTLSPVPLKATFDGSSPIASDCVSKSTLRAALHEVFSERRDDARLFYWPSFEIVRWLSSHIAITPYGGFDGRHVDEELVNAIIHRFIELFFRSAPTAGI